MAMDVELNKKFNDNPSTSSASHQNILDHLVNNDEICFKSQQRNESDLTKQQKIDIALELFESSKLNFLLRFGKYLEKRHLDFFKQFLSDETETESDEIDVVLKDLYKNFDINQRVRIKNRRFQALKQLLNEGTYFTENEMMKRNPLLYEQLVGQYLNDVEKKFRDRNVTDDQPTLVKLLLEGIERDDAEDRRKHEQYCEDEEMEDDDDSEEDADDKSEKCISYTQWGEFHDAPQKIYKNKSKGNQSRMITTEEQELLKDEFISTMYQDFLNGKDADFDYDKIDESNDYDDLEMTGYDEEEKYFDTEEAEENPIQTNQDDDDEDELDAFMKHLNENSTIGDLTKDMAKLGKHNN